MSSALSVVHSACFKAYKALKPSSIFIFTSLSFNVMLYPFLYFAENKSLTKSIYSSKTITAEYV